MLFEESIDLYGPGDRCIICGKEVAGGRGYAHLKHDDQMVTLCCPLCFDTFQKSPKVYANRRRSQRILQTLKTKTG